MSRNVAQTAKAMQDIMRNYFQWLLHGLYRAFASFGTTAAAAAAAA